MADGVTVFHACPVVPLPFKRGPGAMAGILVSDVCIASELPPARVSRLICGMKLALYAARYEQCKRLAFVYGA